MSGSSSRQKQKRDAILLIGLFVLALLLLVFRRAVPKRGEMRVLISQDGVVVHTYPLSENRTEVIPASNGGRNTLHIENGAVWVSDATCPDKICEHSGKITLPGELIVCLPNRLIIQIVDGA